MFWGEIAPSQKKYIFATTNMFIELNHEIHTRCLTIRKLFMIGFSLFCIYERQKTMLGYTEDEESKKQSSKPFNTHEIETGSDRLIALDREYVFICINII